MTDQQHIPAHHPLGPSASSRWINCPGSVLATQDIEETTSEFAAEGSVAHLLTEWVRQDGCPATTFIGKVVEQDGFTFSIDKDMADYAQAFVDHCENYPGDAYVEVKVSMDPWVPGGFGRADDVRIDAENQTIYVTDLKYGRGVEVKAKNNSQAQLYALGVYNTLGWMYGVDDSWSVVNTIYQPRIGNIDSDEPVSIAELVAWADAIVAPAAQMALSEGAPFKAGSWCTFCKIRGSCTERAAMMQREHLSDFDLLTDDLAITEEQTTMRPDQIGRILDAASEIRSWLDAVEEQAMAMMKDGRAPVGGDGAYKLVAGRSSREWVDADKAAAVLRGIVDPDQLYVKKMITPAQAEKLIGKKNDVLPELISTKQGKPTLVPASDKRPGITFDDDLEAL